MVQAAFATTPSALEFPPFLRGLFTALVDELQTLRRREQQMRETLGRFQSQLDEVARLQRELLPTEWPRINGLHVRTLYRPAETVGGDWYDVVRLDDRRTAFLLADATGHGLPAGMLSTLTRRCFQAFRTCDNPVQTLQAANRELRDMSLGECPFVGALHAVYDEGAQIVTLARGGLPYPILARRGQAAKELICTGTALGTVDEALFEPLEIKLSPGDRLIFRTDGVDDLLLRRDNRPRASEIGDCAWFSALSDGSLDDRLHELDDALDSAKSFNLELDDVTVLALETA